MVPGVSDSVALLTIGRSWTIAAVDVVRFPRALRDKAHLETTRLKHNHRFYGSSSFPRHALLKINVKKMVRNFFFIVVADLWFSSSFP